MRAVGTAIRQTVKLFGTHRKLWLPFLIAAGVEAFFLLLIWLAPQQPFSKLLAPPIRYFFGDRVLHYPTHLWFLYQAMKYTHLVTTTLVGTFMTGLVCALVRQAHEGAPFSIREALMTRQVRYGVVVLLWLVTWGASRGAMELLSRFAPQEAWVVWAAIGVTVLIQTLFVYAIPASVFNGSKWWKALLQGIGEAARHPVSTLLVIALPAAMAIAFSMLMPPLRVAHVMAQTAPEIVFLFIAARLLIWTLADALLTIGIAHLWWAHRSTLEGARSACVPQLTPSHYKEGPAVA